MVEPGMARHPNTGNPAPTYARLREKTLALPRFKAPGKFTMAAQDIRGPQLALAVYTALSPLETVWTAFQQQAHSTFYQTFLWCRAWCETVGKARNIEIRIVTGTDQQGEIAFILPLQIRRRSGIRVLEWLGTPHTTYGHGLFAPAFLDHARDWFSRHWNGIVNIAGPVDAVFLADMPEALDAKPHPLQLLFNLREPNRFYRMALETDYEALLARKRSKETRRYYRKKERGFAALGKLSFELPATREETHKTLRTMFEQQEKRLGERGIRGVFGPVEREFIHRLAELQDEANPVFLPYMLKFEGHVVAVLLGGVHANAFWAMISSLAETALRKYSPGDLALRRTIEASCKQGLAQFDFAAGDTQYKLHWAETVMPLHMMLSAITLRALPWVCLTGGATIAKRLIKQSPVVRNAAMSVRKILLGTRFRRGPPQD